MIRFLTWDEVLVIHENQIALYGGTSGLRDAGLLKSALAMPQSGIDERYLHRDLFEMGAAYLYHIVCNHPFIDGNKRTGTVAALVFLELNDVEFNAEEAALESTVLAVAEGLLNKTSVADFLRSNSR